MVLYFRRSLFTPFRIEFVTPSLVAFRIPRRPLPPSLPSAFPMSHPSDVSAGAVPPAALTTEQANQAHPATAAAAAAAMHPPQPLSVLDASSAAPSAPVSSVLDLRFVLDNASVGGVIGKAGNSVREVREQTGVSLSIVKADYRHAQERIMILKGQPQQIALAAKCIATLSAYTAAQRGADAGTDGRTERAEGTMQHKCSRRENYARTTQIGTVGCDADC